MTLQQPSAMSITQLCNVDEPIEQKEQEEQVVNQQHFIHRLPLVNTALKAYNNPGSVVKYGAEMIESYTSPIYDKLGYKTKEQQQDEEDTTIAATTTAFARASLNDINELNHRKSRPTSRSTSPHRNQPYTLSRPAVKNNNSSSRWQQIVLNAGSAAGTTAAVISEESMKCLKYCLSWLHYAIQHIDQQMNLLRNFLVSLVQTKNEKTVSTNVNDENKLESIKKEIVDTLRKVIEVVSKYAGSGLPEQAKASVRSFILELPSRWAILNSKKEQQHSETSIKLLDFGGESIEMLKSISVIFSDTIERAELWIKRLQIVGANAGNTTTTATAASMDLN